ncbi:sodium/potassium/calcium exchanger 1-like isoform X2 [Oncorhynchus kisutch]|uniref:Sodium/potassium/calcium exchanger 1 n=1 Tax=Oncorhynchus kisutch TaxID=8019 RepID=A0A8C7HJC8_ONCKI|nr:sodium/potassium/calcium exchanger 1-like isoform X2 [Oncorhynchus kisutch]XP_031672278.1 sodium/potassium/calcium exchanger 1-like isoform X2 [Oncorhynchus kisutch]
MHLPQRRRLNRSRILFFLSGVLLCCVYTVTFKARLQEPRVARQAAAEEHPGTALPEEGGGSDSSSVLEVDTREVVTSNLSSLTESYNDDVITRAPTVLEGDDVIVITVNRTDIKHCIYVEDPEPEPPTEPPPTSPPPNTTTSPGIPGDVPHRKGEYPEDLFTVDQRRQGWVTLHILGMVYMFVSLAIVCDEFFVPALGVITVKLDISDDVAGATFMAAGGSAPELFTSLIGVFISHSNVGIGTIVGSAVFNILFVIGMCAIFSREMLHLTWWPLFRDVSFYIIDLIMLIVFFLDNTIMWWESVMLVSGYVAYVCFMKFNVQIEHFVKMQINKHKSIVKIIMPEEEEEKEPKKQNSGPPPPDPPQNNVSPEPKPQPQDSPQKRDREKLKVKPTLQRGGSNASLHNSTNRNTIFQLMIHTLDPLGEAGPEKTEQAEPSTSQTTPKEEEKPGPSETQTDQGPAGAGGSDGSDSGEEDESEEESEDEEDEDDEDEEDEEENKEEEEEEGEENEEPLSLEWPDTRRKQATYLFLLPIVFPLWLTVPDVRNPASRKYFAMTFIGSITWIAVFSYLMVWWAHQVGETIGISEEIMGLTILAAGTSIPDLITSVIVARKGLGDMAVSSSVGSNIFDITMGLPVPWLIFSAMQGGVPVAVNSNGLFCAIVLLFVMLLFVIVSIAACRWKMSRVLGLTMFMLYFVFLVLSVMLEDRIIICPVSI